MASILDALSGMFGGANANPQDPQAPQGGGFRDTLGDIGIGLMMSDPNYRGVGQMMAMRQQSAAEQRQQSAQANQTVGWLTNNGVGQQEAEFLARTPEALKSWYTAFSAGQKPDWQITDMYDDQGRKIKAMVDKRTGQYNQIGGAADPAKSGEGEFGLNPQYGVDAQGNPVLLQVGKSGKAIQTAMPEGVTLSKEPIRLDAGTHFVLLDPVTRQQIGQVPKENREAAKESAIGKAQGEAQGEAQVNLGSTLQKADQSIGLIDTMLEHPGLSTATGLSSTLDPRNYIAGTDATNFNVMRKQLEGKAFLEAFQSLKGGGAITEVEGQKATEAIARLSTSQSEKAYRDALTELRGILQQGKARAAQMASGGSSYQPQATTAAGRLRFNPSTGDFE